MATVLTLHLPDRMRADAAAGRVNIINRIATAVAPAGWGLAFQDMDTPSDGYALRLSQAPDGPQCLTLRRAYHYPFWQIEAAAARWGYDVALAEFDPRAIDRQAADGFHRRWAAQVLGDVGIAAREGYIFMPLQGRLLEQRSFQAASPVEMIAMTLATDPARQIRATLHPKELYLPDELAALDDLARSGRFVVQDSGSDALLAGCDYVVTQNSALALTGFFARKPAVLFGQVDFHHIAGSVPHLGVQAAFAKVLGPAPDFAAYLWWFYKTHCINGGAPEAEAQIVARLRRHGWPV